MRVIPSGYDVVMSDQAPSTEIVALDIETTGLDPGESTVIAAGLAGDGWVESCVSRDEQQLLQWLVERVRGLHPSTTLVTWNGSEFDLPFLARRFGVLGIDSGLKLRPTGELGKYGGDLYDGEWSGLHHHDIAPDFRDAAQEAGVRWSLKPVAKEVLSVAPVEVDRRGEAMAALDKATLRLYVESDAEITYKLAGFAGEMQTPLGYSP